MRYRNCIAVLAVLFLATGFGYRLALSAEKKETTRGTETSTLDYQTGVSLTIYNVNLGLVKDQRRIKLVKGIGDLRFMDAASQIIPASVHIKSLVKPETLHVLEQNYEYDLLSPQNLLDKYVGKEVKLSTRNPYTEREELVAATLLSNNGQPIFRTGDEITFGHPGRIIFPGVPEDLNAKPTLVWMLENSLPSAQKIEDSFFEYHIYTLERPAPIKDNQTKQISLVSADTIPVKKELRYSGADYYYFGRYGEAVSNQKIGVFIEISNRKENNLGIPCPRER